jgi:soluble lytic murein transglycosylase
MRLLATAKTAIREEEVAMLGASIGRADIAVIGSKRAHKEEVPPLALAYPTLPVAGANRPEPPLVLALTRQESVFDPEAVSRSDARGLMQLKPTTAKEVATSLGVPFSADRLTLDAAYNIRLGSAYMTKLLDRFGGSYVLAIAGYNAGPNRVRQWVETYGDPRDPRVDVVDWIERIPFNETRNYVQRVLENLQVYRVRLGAARARIGVLKDLEG